MLWWDLKLPLIPLLPTFPLLPQGVMLWWDLLLPPLHYFHGVSKISGDSQLPPIPQVVYALVRFTTSTTSARCLFSGEIYNFLYSHRVSIVWWDLQLPPLPQGVYGIVRFTTSTTSTGCLWCGEIYTFHNFQFFHHFHWRFMVWWDLQLPLLP